MDVLEVLLLRQIICDKSDLISRNSKYKKTPGKHIEKSLESPGILFSTSVQRTLISVNTDGVSDFSLVLFIALFFYFSLYCKY